jgi:hypothetical protein
MNEYIVKFQKNGTIGRDVGPRMRREIRVEAIDEMAAKAIAFREFSDRTFQIVSVEAAPTGE